MPTQPNAFQGVKHYGAEWLAQSSDYSRADEAGEAPAVSRVTPEVLHVRALDLALANGRSGGLVTQADYEQAKRELTGERDFDRQEAILRPVREKKQQNPS